MVSSVCSVCQRALQRRQAIHWCLRSRWNRAGVLHVPSQCVAQRGTPAVLPRVMGDTRSETSKRPPVRRTRAGDRA